MICTNSTVLEPDQLKQIILQLKKELTVSKKQTSQYIRTLISAPDKRQSAANIGYVGVIILTSVALGIIVMDLPRLMNMFRVVKHNIITGHHN